MKTKLKNVKYPNKILLKKSIHSKKGITLVEIMVASVILVLAFVAIIMSYLRCMELSELSKNISISTTAVKNRMEVINNTQFSMIKATYNGIPFNDPDINGIGVSYVDDTNPNLLLITISFCWRQKNGLIIGEDKNLNGVLDAGEDLNGNNMIDSLVSIVSYIYNV